MNLLNGFSPIARAVIVAAAIAVTVVVLQSAASIVAPVLLAAFIAVILTPPLRWLRRKRVPQWISLPLIVILLLEAGSILGLVFTGQLEGFRESLPGYRERLTLLRDQFGLWLEETGVEMAREAVKDIIDPNVAVDLVRVVLSNMRSTFGTGLLVLLSAVFMLLEAPSLLTKLRKAFHLQEEAELRLQRLFSSINHYMVIKSLASLATALCIWGWLWMLAIDYAALWAILAFLLNFIPFIGGLLMAVPPLLLALVEQGTWPAVLVLLGYLAMNAVLGYLVEPRLMGAQLGLSPLVVFASLLIWGWVLGPVGAILAVPLTVLMRIALAGHGDTRWIAILLGPAETPERRKREVPGTVAAEAAPPR